MADDDSIFGKSGIMDLPTPAPSAFRRSGTQAPEASTSMEDLQGKSGSYEIPEPVSFWSEVGRGSLSGVLKGGADVAGLPGELAAGVQWAAPHVGYIGRRVGEAAGLLTPGTAQSVWEQARKEEEQAATPETKSGRYTNVLGYNIPRTAVTQEWTEQNIPGAKFEPKSIYGETAQGIGRFASGTAIPGGLGATLARRGTMATLGAMGRGAVSGAGAGAGFEAAGHGAEALREAGAMSDSPVVEAAMRLSGALVGGGLGSKAANIAQRFVAPSTSATERLGAAMARDYREGTSAMTFEDFQRRMSSGALPIDAMGPRAQKVIAEAARISPVTSEQAGRLATRVAERTDQASQNVSDRISSLFGNRSNPAELSDAIEAANRTHIDNLYNLSRSSPAAASMWSPEIENFTKADAFRKAMSQANSEATFPINKMITPVFDASGNISRAPNLAYWDKVKQYLDDQINDAKGKNAGALARALIDLKKKFVAQLDTAVPAYANARNAAAEVFGSQNALEAGYNALKNVNAFKSQDIKNAFSKMPKDQQELFSTGAAGFLSEFVLDKGINNLNNLLSKEGVSERAKMILGSNNFDNIMNQVKTERTMAGTRVPIPGAGDVGHKWSDILPSMQNFPLIGGAAGLISPAVFSGAIPLTLDHLLTGGAGTIASLVARGAYNASEHQIAKRIMDMAGTTDPRKLARLQSELQSSPGWKEFLAKTLPITLASRTAQYGYLGGVPGALSEPRPQRAAGGKVNEGDIHERLVGRLMDLADKAKKTTQKSTEGLLEAPDEAIVHALKVADNVI